MADGLDQGLDSGNPGVDPAQVAAALSAQQAPTPQVAQPDSLTPGSMPGGVLGPSSPIQSTAMKIGRAHV